MSTATTIPAFVNRPSFIELNARDRARCLMDSGSWRELVGPFDRIESPWLPMQGIAPQSDGCVVLKGTIAGEPAVVVALEGKFQGGSTGEVSGAKMATALDLAALDSRNGKKTAAVLLLETGGVRLQEANLGLAAVAEVMASILALRQHAPIITVIAGTVGVLRRHVPCRGPVELHRRPDAGSRDWGSLNGPEVIEQESGIEEFPAIPPIEAARLGHQRGRTAASARRSPSELVLDDAEQIAEAPPSSGGVKAGRCRRCIAASRSNCIARPSRALDAGRGRVDPLSLREPLERQDEPDTGRGRAP